MGPQLVWRYLQVAEDSTDDYSATDYDDSLWDTGPAPFGAAESPTVDGSQASAYDSRFSATFGTPWDLHTSLWVRRTLPLTVVPPNGIRLTTYIEDNCLVYVNGTLILDTPDGPVGGNGQVFDIADSELVVGDNIVAIRCNDEAIAGTLSYFDMFLEAL
jgi:hypothetical protein